MSNQGSRPRRADPAGHAVPSTPTAMSGNVPQPQEPSASQQALMAGRYPAHPPWSAENWSYYATQAQVYGYSHATSGVMAASSPSHLYGNDVHPGAHATAQDASQTPYRYPQSHLPGLPAAQLTSAPPSRQQSYDSSFYYPAGVAGSPYISSSPGHSDPSTGASVTHYSPPVPSVPTSPGPESSGRSSSGAPRHSASPAPLGDIHYAPQTPHPSQDAYAYHQHAPQVQPSEAFRPGWDSGGPGYGSGYHEANFAPASQGVWYSYDPRVEQQRHVATGRPAMNNQPLTSSDAFSPSGRPAASQARFGAAGYGTSRPVQQRAPHTWTHSVPRPLPVVGGYGYGGHYHPGRNAYYPPPQHQGLQYAPRPPLYAMPQSTRVPQQVAVRPLPTSQAAVIQGLQEPTYPKSRGEGRKKTSIAAGANARQRVAAPEAPRSEYVMWVGNVPSNASSEELHAFLSQLKQPVEPAAAAVAAEDLDAQDMKSEASKLSDTGALGLGCSNDTFGAICDGHGIVSIFVIARSNCAFVNYATAAHLQAAVEFFHDKQLRPTDVSSVRLVCRIRKKEDESQAGVEGQRGRGMHVALVKEYEMKQRQRAADLQTQLNTHTSAGTSVQATTESIAALKPPSEASLSAEVANPGLAVPEVTSPAESASVTSQRPSIGGGTSSSGSISLSTNSSLLKHPVFRQRFFILKSLFVKDLDRCLATSIWATQPHNESVLDQAYRNSEAVYLIFSANQSGNFYGYARMAGAIATPHRSNESTPVASTSMPPEMVRERPPLLASGLPRASDEGARTPQIGRPLEAPGDRQRSVLSPGGASSLSPGLTPNIAASPLQLTPVEEIDQPAADSLTKMRMPVGLEDQTKNILSATWPPDNALSPEVPAPAGRGTTLSPKLIPSRPAVQPEEGKGGASTLEKPSIALSHPADSKANSQAPAALSPTRSLPVPADSEGVKRIDTAQSEREKLSSSPTDSTSLGPADSISVSSANQQAQMSIRAMIHNLRLEEREAQRQANALEGHLAALGEGSLGPPAAHGASTPRANSVGQTRPSSTLNNTGLHNVRENYSWGRPFRVQWLVSTPLPFSKVRKLRNPWRDGKPVMVSRDGTELEPNAGRQLIEEWAKHVAGLTSHKQDARLEGDSPTQELAAVHLNELDVSNDASILAEEDEADAAEADEGGVSV